MNTLRRIAPLPILMMTGACSSLHSSAVRDLAGAEVTHLVSLSQGLADASGRKQVEATDGTIMEVGLAKSLDQLVKGWNDVESTFTLWDRELSRLRLKALAPTPVPSVNARGGELADLIDRALGQEEQVAREASDFESSCIAVKEAEERMTAGVVQMVAQARSVHEFVDRSRFALFVSSLDVASVGAALGEFEEGRELLAKAAELAPKMEKAAGKAGKAASKVGLEVRADEIEVLMGILAERVDALGATAPAQPEDEEETP
jgi:hypothetical protein